MKRKKPNQYPVVHTMVRILDDRDSLADAQIAAAWDKIPDAVRDYCLAQDVASLVFDIATEHALREIAEAKLKALHPLASLLDDGMNALAALWSTVAHRFAVWREHRHAARIERKRRLLLAAAILWTGKLPGVETFEVQR